MPQFSDDLFLGSAQTYMGTNSNSNLGDPSPMDLGVGPVGRLYVWDSVPLTKQTNNISVAATYSGAASAVIAAGTGTTSVVRADGTTVVQVDVPRALSITIGTGTITNRTVTISGYDYYGQAMSEAIATGTTQSTTVNGKKAFYQISGATVSGSVGGTVAIGTTDIFGSPVRFTDRGYLDSVGWNNTLAEDAATTVVADTTSPATTTTGDVRGTVQPSSASDGTKRLVVGVYLPGIAVGPNATRVGALGVNQNLVS